MSLPVSRVIARTAATATRALNPRCCGSSAPARSRRLRRATCSNATSSLSSSPTTTMSPSKSDLQQCDIVVVGDDAMRGSIGQLIPDMPWIVTAPVFLVFLANGRRLKRITELRGKPFLNDHLDQFFNAAVDAGIVLATFIRAAEAVGLGCCPISVIRDHAARVSDMLELPDRVIPVSGMCIGWQAEAGHISPRLSLALPLP